MPSVSPTTAVLSRLFSPSSCGAPADNRSSAIDGPREDSAAFTGGAAGSGASQDYSGTGVDPVMSHHLVSRPGQPHSHLDESLRRAIPRFPGLLNLGGAGHPRRGAARHLAPEKNVTRFRGATPPIPTARFMGLSTPNSSCAIRAGGLVRHARGTSATREMSP